MRRLLALAAVAALVFVPGRIAAHDVPQQTPRLDEGKKLFHDRCGYCHLAGGTGTIMLGRRLGKDRALLEDRTDLGADYIRHVVRWGLGGMPAHTRIEVPDNELNAIIEYLTRPESARGHK